MSASLSLTNTELLRAAINAAGIGRDVATLDDAAEADLRQIVRSGLRRFHFPIVDGFPYQWRWLERYHAIPANDPYETGTVTISAGTITLAGGTWPTWAADGFLSVDGHIVFVEARTDGTFLTTLHTELAVAAGTTYTLNRYRYSLPSDFVEWVGAVTYSSETDNWILSPSSEAELRLRYAVNYNYNNRTSHYAITAAQDGDFQFLVWPVMVKNAFVRGVYIYAPEDNLETDLRTPDPTPIIQAKSPYAEAAIEAILAAAEAYNDDAIGIHEQRYQSALAAAIAHDKAATDGYDFSRHLGRRVSRRIYPNSIDFSDQIS